MSVITVIRQNHALEHATIAVLLQRLGQPVRMIGYSYPGGYLIVGDVPTPLLTASAHDALARLRAGETNLAVTPNCGTNIAITGVLTGLSAALTVARRQSVPWSQALLAATGAVVLSRPVGLLVQKHITTSAEVEDVQIDRIQRSGRGSWTIHRIQTSRI